MSTLTATKITETGTGSGATTTAVSDPAKYAATGGDEFVNNGVEFLHIQNNHASGTYTVRATAQTTSIRNSTYGIVTKDHVDKSVGPGASIFMGPFKQGAFNDANGKVQLTYKTTGTYSSGAALSTIGCGSTHKLKVEVLYLDNQ